MPLISIITPVYDTPEPVLRAMIDSVRSQSFTDWELCMVDDCSPSPRPREVLAEYAAMDPRIRFRVRESNGGIVHASNDCLAMARGEFVSFLDHDDELYEGALAHTVEALRSADDVDYVYTDEDKLDEDGHRHSPFFKPDWSPERFRYQMYTCHFGTMRRSLVEEVGGFRADFEGSQDFDLVFRVTERARRIVHVPHVLYGWRIIEGSAAGDINAKPYAWLAGQRAIQSHCDRVGFQAEVAHDMAQPGWYRLQPRLEEHPPVSIVIPTNGDSAIIHGERRNLVVNCVRSIVERSTYDNYELVVVADAVVSDDTIGRLRDIAGDRLRIVPFPKPFNFSEKINTGAVRSDGEHLVLLNDDIEVLSRDWIESLVMYSSFDGIGAVGPKLLFEDGRIQHAGIALSVADSGPIHLYRGFSGDHAGYSSAVRVSMNLLAVTGAAMMTSREAFESVGGFSERFPGSYNDIDYCLKLHDAGYRVAYNPETVLHHFESLTRDPTVHPDELAEFCRRWETYLGNDPYSSGLLSHGTSGQNPPADYALGMDRPPVRST